MTVAGGGASVVFCLILEALDIFGTSNCISASKGMVRQIRRDWLVSVWSARATLESARQPKNRASHKEPECKKPHAAEEPANERNLG